MALFKIFLRPVQSRMWMCDLRLKTLLLDKTPLSGTTCASCKSLFHSGGLQSNLGGKSTDEVRASAVSKKYGPVPEAYKDMNFKRFYRFPLIRVPRMIARAKIYQTGLSVTFVPLVGYLYAAGQVGLVTVNATLGIATFAGGMLYVIGGYLRKFVGLMSLSEDETVVRIARLTFWGNRRNVYVPVADIIPLTDYLNNPNDIYIELRRYSTKDLLYFTLKFGGIDDAEKFTKIFGSVD